MTNRVLEIRLDHKVKRVDLAKYLEVDYVTLYRWEVKQYPVPTDQLMKIARFFEIAVVDIVPEMATPQKEVVNV